MAHRLCGMIDVNASISQLDLHAGTMTGEGYELL